MHIGLSAQNLASGKPVYVSSSESTLYLGNNAVDGNIATRWSSEFIEPSWIYIDLEELVQINKVILHWEDAYAQKYTIEISADSNTWTTVYSEQNSDGHIDQINFELVTTRYVRMWGITRATVYGFSLFEFEIYGPETQLSSDASLSSIYIGNEILSYFKASNYSYNYSLFPSQTDPPQISAIASSTSATIYIEQAQSLSSPATITVVSADGSSIKVYDVNFYKPNFNSLVWFDEFNDDGNYYTSEINSPEISKWHHQIHPPNGHSWFNGEHQHYTNRIENSSVSNGALRIKSKKETYTYNGSTKEYSSARINSKFSFLYGRVDIRAKLPNSAGTWPAFWTLGDNINEFGNYFGDTYGDVGWPACGEIDIMEQNGWHHRIQRCGLRLNRGPRPGPSLDHGKMENRGNVRKVLRTALPALSWEENGKTWAGPEKYFVPHLLGRDLPVNEAKIFYGFGNRYIEMPETTNAMVNAPRKGSPSE